jgi:hypothetical protein
MKRCSHNCAKALILVQTIMPMRPFLIVSMILLPGVFHAQQTLFTEDFDGQAAFDLNTADVGSTTVGDNTWLINNVYAGGSGSVVCLGFPLPFTVATTAAQPLAVPSANGNYLHTTSTAAVNSGIQNCCFLAADGLCANAANHFARMNTDVNTVGASDVTLSFWWLCGGGSNNYGEVHYSTNAGSSWNLVSTPIAQYRNQTSWVQQSITLPAFGGQATLRFAFRFVNGTTTTAQDPGFGVDAIRVTSAGQVPASIATGVVAPAQVCQGATVTIPYVATGTFALGNTFTAQLSDASGSFTAPVTIGSVSATTSGSIVGNIPFGAAPGAGYRVRVVSSDPVLVGAAGSTTITVSSAPFAGADGTISLCKNTGTYDLSQLLGPGVSTCGVWTAPGGVPFSGTFDTDTQGSTPFTYTTNCPGGCPQDEALITVSVTIPANAGQDVDLALCENSAPISLIGNVSGGDLTGLFYYQGQTNPLPNFSVPGSYALDYIVFGTGPCPNDTALFTVTVNAAPDAGTNATQTLCSNGPTADLLSILGGDAGGTWIDPNGAPFSGILDPLTGLSGLYTYTLPGEAPCASAQAVVAVVIDPCSGMADLDPDGSPVRLAGRNAEGQLLDLGTSTLVGIALFDVTGRAMRVPDVSISDGLVLVPMDQLPTGVYLLHLHTSQGRYGFKVLHEQ